MPVAGLLALGSSRGALDFFSQSHQNSHNRVAGATGTPFIIVDPLNLQDEQARKVFLLDHSRAHTLVNEFFGTTGPDLSEVNFDDPKDLAAWVDLNYLDHQQWEASLGISS